MSRTVSLPLRPTLCQSCICPMTPVRSFTSQTSPYTNIKTEATPPESPRYAPVPRSAQAKAIYKPRVRGVLPTPRDILHRKNEAGKTRYKADNYFQTMMETAPAPKDRPESSSSTRQHNDPHAARNAWKERLSVQRRQNLMEGIKDLQVRKVKGKMAADKISSRRKKQRSALRTERLARKDEEYTNPTITQAMQLGEKARIPDPNREIRIAEMRERVQVIEEGRSRDRKDALHTLYMHARDFIVTEEQLDAAIEKCFGTADAPKTWGNYGVSVWHTGPPASLATQLEMANGTNTSASKPEGLAKVAKNRIKRIAEELTGGKI